MKAIKTYNIILLGAIVCLPALCFGQNTNTAKTAATIKAQPVELKIKNKEEIAQEKEQRKQAQLIEKDATYNKEQPASPKESSRTKGQETDKAWGNYEEESNDKAEPVSNEMMRIDNSSMEMQPQIMQMRKKENTINKDEQKPKQE